MKKLPDGSVVRELQRVKKSLAEFAARRRQRDVNPFVKKGKALFDSFKLPDSSVVRELVAMRSFP